MQIQQLKENLNPNMFWIYLDNNIREDGLYKGIEKINEIRKEAVELIFEHISFDQSTDFKKWFGFNMALHIIHPDTYYEITEKIKEQKLKKDPNCDIDYEMHYLMYSSLSLLCTLLTIIEKSEKGE